MSSRPFVPDLDIKRLQDEGYNIVVQQGHLLVHVPYVNAERKVQHGIIVTDLASNVGSPVPPSNHQVWFTGEFPCYPNGAPIEALRNEGMSTLWPGFTVQHRFSNKPEGVSAFPDYYSKMKHYIRIISDQAIAIDPNANPCTFDVIHSTENESVFRYWDTASSRANILPITAKLAVGRVAIVGLGGTGSYVLDQIAKTPIGEIHLFDGDVFSQHNAFRSPGAATIDALDTKPPKVTYFSGLYSAMHRCVIPHNEYVTDENVHFLADFDFVFLCVDRNDVRNFIGRFLRDQSVPFVDVGMDILLNRETNSLYGSCRSTLITPAKSDHFEKHVASLGTDDGDDVYKSNIQVADMNAFNAIIAVMMWKQHCGFYENPHKPHHIIFAVNLNSMARAETSEGVVSPL